jgi:DNA polymerase-3 subunit delta
MKLEDLTRELAEGTLRPAYLIAGEEPLLRDDALTALRSAALGGGLEAFNFDRIDAASSTPGAVVDAVRTLPVMAARRLVIVEEPDARRGGARGIADALADLVADLEAGGPTVLVVVANRPDRRLRWVKAFGSAVVDCEPPRRARDVALFARAEADRQGIALERGAAELLAERTGPQLLMLRQEIAKLGLLAGPSAPVTRAHVSAGTPQVADEPVWDLNDAIAEGRSADAIRVLGHLLASGSAPPAVLGALVSHFRRLLRADQGGQLTGPPFVRKKLQSQARRYGTRRLRAALDAIHQTDVAIKGAGALRPELALERLVIALSG